jgi:spermidine synthase
VFALLLLAKARTPRFSTAGFAAISGAILFILGIDPSGEPVAKGFGFYTEPRAYDRYDTSGLRDLVAAHQLLYYRDGPTATVSVQMVDRYLFLKINGKTDASNGPGDTDTQLLLGHLPLLAAKADKVAIIGWGSGMTSGAVLSHDVEKVDAFEIEPAVVEASRFFDSINGNPLEDPRLQLILGDARSRLYRSNETYDLMISEPSNPWITGVANLFTKEFFELAASRLHPDGILAQWFHLYGMSEESTRSLLATFQSVFPHTLVFKDRDLILLGSRKPIRFDVTRMEKMFERPRIKESLSMSMVRYPFDLLADLRLDGKGLEAYTKDARLNTDDNLLLELAAPRTLYKDQIESIRAGMARHSALVLDHVTGYSSPAKAQLELASSYYTSERKDEALATCRKSLEIENSFEGRKLLGIILENLGQRNEAREALEEALRLGGDPQGRRFVEALIRSIDSPISP